MSEIWEGFDLQPVPEVTDIDRATYERVYRGKCPVIVRGGARRTAAFEHWDPPYLAEKAGDAEVKVAAYAADRRDYGAIESRQMSMREFLNGFEQAGGDEIRYLFNNESCVFVRNEGQPRFHVGWGSKTNAGMAQLAADFEVPDFVDPERFVLGVIILGSQENATDLHYDHGGEGKVLVQLRGRKRLLLMPSTSAGALDLHSLYLKPGGAARAGSRPTVDIHAQANGSDAPRLTGYTADLEPGDIAYWPPFWFHDLGNLDPFTLAVGVMVDELTIPPLLMRHLARGVFAGVLAAAARRASDGSPSPFENGGWDLDVSLDGQHLGSLADLFSDLEARLLAESERGTEQLWQWNE
ncbi:MAG TPA: cupin-like domain-containing protein, partial [Candidatus Limnocylindrales bacterium]|nr:cupin-like domain-containing protein [Candidatus Limnocylindrales bacterium]